MKQNSKPSNFKTSKPPNLQTFKPYCLTIAASDTSGGAGVQRDIKTFHDLGVSGLSVVTGITAQTDKKVFFSEALTVKEVKIQLKTILETYPISSLKIGVVFNKEIMECISYFLKKYDVKNVLIDPILKASDTYSFLDKESYSYMNNEFLKVSDIITPNIPELEKLSAQSISNKDELLSAAQEISQRYDCYVFAKGGHLKEQSTITDYLIKGDEVDIFPSPNKHLSEIHGTGCLISSAITAFLALGGDIKTTIVKAKNYFYSILA
ncbi:MAG: hydroxymethylpyrimidine/phosphomethylpyrimidine kinase [Candidatus Cloacimonetes bacterium]|nr:hydroxymethylpyrimidine/phosphomethylpyrimidine kinase [Candidatus Cloacimonadota bacterium]